MRTEGIFYLLKHNSIPDLVKPGWTRYCTDDRIASYTYSCPRDWTIVREIYGEQAFALEQSMHAACRAELEQVHKYGSVEMYLDPDNRILDVLEEVYSDHSRHDDAGAMRRYIDKLRVQETALLARLALIEAPDPGRHMAGDHMYARDRPTPATVYAAQYTTPPPLVSVPEEVFNAAFMGLIFACFGLIVPFFDFLPALLVLVPVSAAYGLWVGLDGKRQAPILQAAYEEKCKGKADSAAAHHLDHCLGLWEVYSTSPELNSARRSMDNSIEHVRDSIDNNTAILASMA